MEEKDYQLYRRSQMTGQARDEEEEDEDNEEIFTMNTLTGLRSCTGH